MWSWYHRVDGLSVMSPPRGSQEARIEQRIGIVIMTAAGRDHRIEGGSVVRGASGKAVRTKREVGPVLMHCKLGKPEARVQWIQVVRETDRIARVNKCVERGPGREGPDRDVRVLISTDRSLETPVFEVLMRVHRALLGHQLVVIGDYCPLGHACALQPGNVIERPLIQSEWRDGHGRRRSRQWIPERCGRRALRRVRMQSREPAFGGSQQGARRHRTILQDLASCHDIFSLRNEEAHSGTGRGLTVFWVIAPGSVCPDYPRLSV